ncbi:hypothetical protein [Microbaculum marinum]|uniref:Uncharacterized protein n=1 Tax=Microbaculum marinum TaxID=1764581 RepID=A0AAW9RQG3_9HYPH
MGNITRRIVLGLAGIAGVGALAFGGSLAACRLVPRNSPGFFAYLSEIARDQAARRIGRAMVGSGHVSGDLEAIAARITQRPLIREAFATGCPRTRRRLVQDQCAADFRDGRMVSVEGWVLSETEAELCAAAWIADGRTA